MLELHLYGIEEDKEVIPNPSHIIEINHTKNQAIVLIKAIIHFLTFFYFSLLLNYK